MLVFMASNFISEVSLGMLLLMRVCSFLDQLLQFMLEPSILNQLKLIV